MPFDPQESLRSFEQGRLIEENGRKIRLFEVEARSITVPLASGVLFKAWTLNGRIPGPTLRATQGERIRVVFRNADSTSHSLNFHGIHPATMDGIKVSTSPWWPSWIPFNSLGFARAFALI